MAVALKAESNALKSAEQKKIEDIKVFKEEELGDDDMGGVISVTVVATGFPE